MHFPLPINPDFSGATLSRRQFLQSVVALGLLSMGASALFRPRAEALPVLPVWWMTLESGLQSAQRGLVHSPPGLSAPTGLPGSLMKLVATTALLEEKLISSNQLLECRGSVSMQGQTFRCQHPHGKLGLAEAIGLSCNVFFAKAVTPLSVRRFLHYAEQFQLNQPTVPAASFRFPRELDAKHPIQSYALGLNRNLQPNALQLLRMTAHLAKRDVPGLASNTWNLLQQGMHIATVHGTASQLDPQNKRHIAAKTGTTEHGHAFESWLIGYFPLEAPRYAFCTRSAYGTAKDQAVPLTRQFLASRAWHSL